MFAAAGDIRLPDIQKALYLCSRTVAHYIITVSWFSFGFGCVTVCAEADWQSEAKAGDGA